MAAELLHCCGELGDVFFLLFAELFQGGSRLDGHEAAFAESGVEARLEVLQGQRVVEDADIAAAEFRHLCHRLTAAAGGEERGCRDRAPGERDEAAPRDRRTAGRHLNVPFRRAAVYWTV